MTTMICRLCIGNPAEKSYEIISMKIRDYMVQVGEYPRTKHDLIALKRAIMAHNPASYIGKSYHCKDGFRYEVYNFEYKVE